MELDTNPTKPTKCVRLIRSPTYRELTVLYIYTLFIYKSKPQTTSSSSSSSSCSRYIHTLMHTCYPIINAHTRALYMPLDVRPHHHAYDFSQGNLVTLYPNGLDTAINFLIEFSDVLLPYPSPSLSHPAVHLTANPSPRPLSLPLSLSIPLPPRRKPFS